MVQAPMQHEQGAACRQGVEYVLDVCRAELQLAAAFFHTTHHPTAQADLIEAVCSVLADVLRPQYIQLRELDDLGDLVGVLRQAVAADALAHRSSRAARSAEAAVFRIMHDVQERLIFRASVRHRETEPSARSFHFACLLLLFVH